MKLYIRFGSLAKFQDLFDSSEYLQKVLIPVGGNSYSVETDDTTEIRRLFVANRIKYTTE